MSQILFSRAFMCIWYQGFRVQSFEGRSYTGVAFYVSSDLQKTLHVQEFKKSEKVDS